MKKCVITRLFYEEKPFRFLYLLDEKQQPIEIHVESLEHPSLVGNIYVARIDKLMTSPKACFVTTQEGESFYLPLQEKDALQYASKISKSEGPHVGDFLFVKVVKDPIRSKNAVVSSEISVSGTHMELSYAELDLKNSKIRVSRKLSSEKRDELIQSLSSTVSNEHKMVLRTNSKDCSVSELIQEYEKLSNALKGIKDRGKYSKKPMCLYEGISELEEIVLHLPVDMEILTDDMDFFEKMKETREVHFYEDSYPLSMLYSLEKKLSDALKKTIHLKSGGSLVIEATEAMYVIDVNSAHDHGGKHTDRQSFDTNMEACQEIADQIRLRNLSGMILVDFINMKEKQQEEQLIQNMRQCVAQDSSRVRVHDITCLGIMELTREKHRSSLKQVLTGNI